MLDKTVRDLINNQINQELYSAYLYMDFVRYFAERGLNGYANWYTVQAKEELDHARIFFDYLISQDVPVTLTTIAAPIIPGNCCSICGDTDCDLKVLEEGLTHEKLITSLIDDIYSAALNAEDYRTVNFLGWFIEEQKEEEDNAAKLISDMSLFGATPEGLHSLDSEASKRKYEKEIHQ